MKRPSFQFYPADWQSNPNLRRCTHAEKGMWIDIMCLLHDGEEYGVLRWPLKEIAAAIGATVSAVHGLVRKGVLKGSDTQCEAFIYVPRSGRKNGDPVTLIEIQPGPLWFSSRMVTDEYKARVREKSFTQGSPKQGNGECKDDNKGEVKDAHPSDHHSRGGAPAAPSSSSSSSPSGISSEANASGAAAPQNVIEIKAAIFRQGLEALMKTGMKESDARTMIGHWRKDAGDGALLDILSEMMAKGITEPKSWVTAAILNRKRSGPRPSRQSPVQSGVIV